MTGEAAKPEIIPLLIAPAGRKSNPLVDWLVRLATLEGALAAACRDAPKWISSP